MESGCGLGHPFKWGGGAGGGFWEEKGLPVAISFMATWNDY